MLGQATRTPIPRELTMLIAQTEAEYLRAAIAARCPRRSGKLWCCARSKALITVEIGRGDRRWPIGTVMSRLLPVRAAGSFAVIGGKKHVGLGRRHTSKAKAIHNSSKMVNRRYANPLTQATASGRLETRQC